MSDSVKSRKEKDISQLQSVIRATCFHCRKRIEEDTFVLSTEQTFHIKCFRCVLCKKQLKPGEHLLYDRYLYCKKDCLPLEEKQYSPAEAQEHFNTLLEGSVHKGHRISQRCSSCQLPVRGTDYVVSLNLVWHRICLRCVLCSRNLTPGDHAIYRPEGSAEQLGPYCIYPCYERKFQKPSAVGIVRAQP